MRSRDIARLLAGYNCGECGYKSCRDFADCLLSGGDLCLCPFMSQDKFKEKAAEIEALLDQRCAEETAGSGSNREMRGAVGTSMTFGARSEGEIRGVIDGLVADFALSPLPGESSCREDLIILDSGTSPKAGDLLRYRPLGCPITHFGRVLKVGRGLVTVHIVGPRHLLGDGDFQYTDAGICLVAAFEGVVSRGREPDVGETVRFLPEHCMMQKVHSGVVVHSEGRMVRIEAVDLKVW